MKLLNYSFNMWFQNCRALLSHEGIISQTMSIFMDTYLKNGLLYYTWDELYGEGGPIHLA